MSEHTQGPATPWRVVNLHPNFVRLDDAEGREFARVYFRSFDSPADRAAVGNLLLAAPAMLEALEAVMRVYHRYAVDEPWRDAHEWFKAAAAIAEAKGEE